MQSYLIPIKYWTFAEFIAQNPESSRPHLLSIPECLNPQSPNVLRRSISACETLSAERRRGGGAVIKTSAKAGKSPGVRGGDHRNLPGREEGGRYPMAGVGLAAFGGGKAQICKVPRERERGREGRKITSSAEGTTSCGFHGLIKGALFGFTSAVLLIIVTFPPLLFVYGGRGSVSSGSGLYSHAIYGVPLPLCLRKERGEVRKGRPRGV